MRQRIGLTRDSSASRRYTPAVLSLGILCEDHGCSYDWTSGQKPQLIKDGRRIKCSTENYVPIVVPGLSTGSSSSATPTSPTSVPQEAVTPTLHPASTRSQSTSCTVREGTRRMNQQKPSTQTKMETTRPYGETRCVTCQNGEKNLPKTKCFFFLTSRETENVRSVRGPQLYGPCAEDALAEPYLELKNLVTLSQQITKFLVKYVNLETIVDTLSWCKTWPPNGSSRIRAKTKLHKKPRGACKSSWTPDRNPKVIYTDNSLEFGKSCEDLFLESLYVNAQIGNKWYC